MTVRLSSLMMLRNADVGNDVSYSFFIDRTQLIKEALSIGDRPTFDQPCLLSEDPWRSIGTL